jgi:hypothetical protein
LIQSFLSGNFTRISRIYPPDPKIKCRGSI